MTCGDSASEFRLFSADAALHAVKRTKNVVTYELSSPIPVRMVFEGYDKARRVTITDRTGSNVAFEREAVLDTGKTVLTTATGGDLVVTAEPA